MENKITLKDIISKSVFGSVGTINSDQDLKMFYGYVKHNRDFLCYFQDLIFVLNGNIQIIETIPKEIEDILPKNTVHIVVTENLGHTFGTMLNDSSVCSYAAQLPYDYIWKFSNDVTVDPNILHKTITTNKDFYYINNIGYNVFNTYSKKTLLDALLTQTFYYPQTNYYIIKNRIKFYPDIQTIYKLKKEYEDIKSKNPGIQPWHAISGCDCEHMLAKTVEINNLTKEHLLSHQSTHNIIQLIFDQQVHDGSHKNIAYEELGNLCHLHYPGHPVVIIESESGHLDQ